MATSVVRYNRPIPLSAAMDQLFRDAFAWPRVLGADGSRGFAGGLGSNLYETDDEYILQMALPGVKADELEITAHRNILSLQGSTGVAAPEGARGLWTGLPDGQFSEQLTLPGEVDADAATADYHDGILTLTLPKAAHTRAKKIAVSNSRQTTIDQPAK
jgi:HSP20 family protein